MMLALKELLHNLKDRDWDVNPIYKIDENEAKKIIEALEELKSEGRLEEKGEWFSTGAIGRNEHNQLLYECQCSVCRGLSYFRKETLTHDFVGAKFCDHCGADMRGDEE